MKLLLATADLDDIRWAAGDGLLNGVLTTPSLLRDAGSAGDRARVEEI
jgi:hypothetical protein